MVQHSENSSSISYKIKLPYDPTVTLSIYSREMKSHVQIKHMYTDVFCKFV